MGKRNASAGSSGPESKPGIESNLKKPAFSAKGVVAILLLLVALFAAGFYTGRKSLQDAATHPDLPAATGAVKAKPGPWGNLEITPITITAPTELLKVRGTEEAPVKWLFKGYTRETLVQLLNTLAITGSPQEKLLDPRSLSLSAAGIEMIPPRDALVNLPSAALAGIYRALADFPENDAYRDVFLSKDIEAFQESGISQQTVSIIRSLSSSSGNYMVCYCMAYVLSAVPTFEEKANVLEAFTRQKTMLLKLRVTPNSDVNALTKYWGKAFWTTNVSALLESVGKNPAGGLISVGSLLPPLPRARLYTYPLPQNGLAGPVVHQDCHWTSFNFFRDPPDTHFSEPGYIFDKLKTDYYPLQSDPLYGDVILLAKPNGSILHSMVYIADDIVYTKNGENLWHPWMFSRLSDVVDIYSASLAPGENLSLRYFRNKYY